MCIRLLVQKPTLTTPLPRSMYHPQTKYLVPHKVAQSGCSREKEGQELMVDGWHRQVLTGVGSCQIALEWGQGRGML